MQINFHNYIQTVRLSGYLWSCLCGVAGAGVVRAAVMISGPIVTQSPGARQHQTLDSGDSRDSLLLPNYSSWAQPPHNSSHCPQLKTKLYALQILFQGVNCTINKAEKLMNLLKKCLISLGCGVLIVLECGDIMNICWLSEQLTILTPITHFREHI